MFHYGNLPVFLSPFYFGAGSAGSILAHASNRPVITSNLKPYFFPKTFSFLGLHKTNLRKNLFSYFWCIIFTQAGRVL